MQGEAQAAPAIFTVGHSTRTAEEFISLLLAHGVTLLADVRTVPRSRANPQFNKDTLPATLAAAGLRYLHLPDLGGLRKSKPDSINSDWRNLSFRGYADYMRTAEFHAGLDHLIRLAAMDQVAIMCAEAVPWRCHRSLIADALAARGIATWELVSKTRRQPHRMTPFAKVSGAAVTYPPELAEIPGA